MRGCWSGKSLNRTKFAMNLGCHRLRTPARFGAFDAANELLIVRGIRQNQLHEVGKQNMCRMAEAGRSDHDAHIQFLRMSLQSLDERIKVFLSMRLGVGRRTGDEVTLVDEKDDGFAGSNNIGGQEKLKRVLVEHVDLLLDTMLIDLSRIAPAQIHNHEDAVNVSLATVDFPAHELRLRVDDMLPAPIVKLEHVFRVRLTAFDEAHGPLVPLHFRAFNGAKIHEGVGPFQRERAFSGRFHADGEDPINNSLHLRSRLQFFFARLEVLLGGIEPAKRFLVLGFQRQDFLLMLPNLLLQLSSAFAHGIPIVFRTVHFVGQLGIATPKKSNNSCKKQDDNDDGDEER